MTDIRENINPVVLVFTNELGDTYKSFALPSRNQYAYGLYICDGFFVDSICVENTYNVPETGSISVKAIRYLGC
jgi:hypothetical protein